MVEQLYEAEELDHVNTYEVGENIITIEHQAVYIGSSHGYDGGDWLNISRVFINDIQLFDHRIFGYVPQPTDDEQLIKLTLACPETKEAREVTTQYEKYEWEISRMSALERFFNRKTYLNLTRELKKLEGEYMHIEQIIHASSALKKAEMIAKQKKENKNSNTEQPGSY